MKAIKLLIVLAMAINFIGCDEQALEKAIKEDLSSQIYMMKVEDQTPVYYNCTLSDCPPANELTIYYKINIDEDGMSIDVKYQDLENPHPLNYSLSDAVVEMETYKGTITFLEFSDNMEFFRIDGTQISSNMGHSNFDLL